MYFKGIVAWDGFGPILSLFLSYLNRKCSTVTLFCTVQQWLSIPELMHSIKWKENVALITLARCQVTFWKTEKKKKYFEVSMKQDGSVIKFYICLAQTGQNKVTWKTPSSAAFVPLLGTGEGKHPWCCGLSWVAPFFLSQAGHSLSIIDRSD